MNVERVWTPSERTMETLGKETVTASEVKDVLIECFCYAHGDYEQAIYILKNQAINVGMHWDKPDKQGIMLLIPKLEEVASTFRNPDVVLKNKVKIQKLLSKCCED